MMMEVKKVITVRQRSLYTLSDNFPLQTTTHSLNSTPLKIFSREDSVMVEIGFPDFEK